MTVLKDIIANNGKRRITLEVDVDSMIVVLDPKQYYKLGYPIEDIVEGRQIVEAVPVTWCVVDQKWVT